MGKKAHRKQVSFETITNAVATTERRLFARLDQKGYGTFASKHEILGILQEEMYEVTRAVHRETHLDLISELEDVAVAAIFGIACIRDQAIDWYLKRSTT